MAAMISVISETNVRLQNLQLRDRARKWHATNLSRASVINMCMTLRSTSGLHRSTGDKVGDLSLCPSSLPFSDSGMVASQEKKGLS